MNSPEAPEFLHEPARRTPVLASVEVLVCGGGPAGVAAAVAAARAGRRTLLVESSGQLGGAAVQALVLPLMTFHASPGDQVVRGIGESMVARARALGGCPGHLPDPLGCAATITPVDPEVWRLAVLQEVTSSGAEVLLLTQVVGALVEEGRVSGALVEGKAGRQAIRAEVVVDASGDGDLAARAGAAFEVGRPGDGATQPMTLVFRLGGVDGGALREAVRRSPADFVLADWAREDLDRVPLLGVAGFFSLVREARESGELADFRDRVLCFELPAPGEVVVNMTRVLGASGLRPADLTRATREGLEQVHQVLAFLHRRVPGFREARLLQTAPRIGVRETRHLLGRSRLEVGDVLAGLQPPDGVARGAFPVDLHSPDGAGLSMRTMAPGASYSIPFGCLLPRDLEGLLVAGRAISASHEASASARLSPTCMALGEAAGEAAVLALERGVPPGDVDLGELRERLRQQGAVV